MEDSDSKRNDSPSFAHNEETRIFKELQALMSCSVPTDLLMSILQSQMLCHSNNDIHQSISHLLISYSGKRGSIANITILPLDIAQIIRYLFGVSIAIVNCTQYTTLKDLVTKLPVHTTVNYKEWTQQLKNKMIANHNKNNEKINENTNENKSDDKKSLNSPNNKSETKDNDDEIASQILILSDTYTNSNIPRPSNNINIISPQLTHDHEESHSSLLHTTNSQIKRYLTEPTLTKTSRTSSPSATPPPDEKEQKENKEQHIMYGIKEEQAVTHKYHKNNNHFLKHNHSMRDTRDHLSQSIHSLHKLQHSQSGLTTGDGYHSNMNMKNMNGMDNGNINAKNSKYKMDCISCQCIIFHNIHKLTRAMQSIVIQIMKMKSIPSYEHSTHRTPREQLCILTRQCNKTIPYLLRDLCLTDYVINNKKIIRKLHRFITYEITEYKQSYYAHVSGISFDGSDNKFKLSQLSQCDNNLNVSYNMLSSQSPSNNIATTPMKLKDSKDSNDNSSDSTCNIGLFPLVRLKILYSLVKNVFIHNSIAQYIRDIIIAIRLHPDVKQGCSSFRANEALNISSKFSNFMSRLDDRYKLLRNSNKYIDQLIAKVHFVRPKDVDQMAIQILAHRIDMIASEYSPAHTPEHNNNNNIIKQNNIRNMKMKFKNKKKAQYLKMKTMPFSQIQPMKSFPMPREEIISGQLHGHSENERSDNSVEEEQKGHRIRRDFSIKARAEILKQLRLDTKSSRRRGGGYRTGSMSLPRTPRVRRSVSLSHGQIHDDVSKLYMRRDKRPKKFSEYKLNISGKDRNKNSKENDISSDDVDGIDIDNFEFELFEDSDEYDYIDEEYEIDYDCDGYGMDNDDIDGHGDGDDNHGYGGSGRGYDDDVGDEYGGDGMQEYDEFIGGDDMGVDNDYYNADRSSKRNSNRGYNGDSYTQYSLLNEMNEKKLSVQQRLVYNLLRRVLLPPK